MFSRQNSGLTDKQIIIIRKNKLTVRQDGVTLNHIFSVNASKMIDYAIAVVPCFNLFY